jgi:CubicO group peptidase (beta-lactamase class C family)
MLLCETEYFQGFVQRRPVFLIQSTPIYSNTAFRILSYALEAIAGDDFENFMERNVIKLFRLDYTGFHKPADKLGVIPLGDSIWSYDIGDEAP